MTESTLCRFSNAVNTTAHYILLDKFLKDAKTPKSDDPVGFKCVYREAGLEVYPRIQDPTIRYFHRLHHSVPEMRRTISLSRI
jgi:hypothetical protein